MTHSSPTVPCLLSPVPCQLSMRWYCIHTKPGKEEAADRYVGQVLACETYYPRLRRRRLVGRAKQWVQGPLFPRYLFARFDLVERYRAVRYAPEVNDVVSFAGHPTVVDDAVIEQLKQWAGPALDVLTIQPAFRPGELVEIVDGPLRGMQAIVKGELNDRERVAVLLSALAYQPQVVIERSQLARVA